MFVSPSAQPLQIDEGIEIVTTPTSAVLETITSTHEPEQRSKVRPLAVRCNLREAPATTPTTNMDELIQN